MAMIAARDQTWTWSLDSASACSKSEPPDHADRFDRVNSQDAHKFTLPSIDPLHSTLWHNQLRHFLALSSEGSAAVHCWKLDN